MKRVTLSLVLFIFALAGCAGHESPDTYEVTKVIDGDTFKVNYEGKEETIRLLLIDTPETVSRKPEQPFGKEASDFMKDKLSGEYVRLELDVSERDKYGRILAYAYDAEGEMLNEQLLRKGLARVPYIFPPNTKYVDRFQEIQREAQKKKVGIWSIEDYVTDEGFQTTENTNENDPSQCKIKGNINSSGEKIYHLPGGSSYEVTKPEQIFCTIEEAKDAGFRPVKR